ncbi:MAG: DoxX family protein [Planctomycetota bacterium]|nr:DoxX family protein [Planctomycetota bacterium]
MHDLGLLLLRLTVGGLMIPHGIAKIENGTKGIAKMLEAEGLPEFLQYGVYVGELAAPALIIIGFFTRISALVLAGNMAVAVYLAHMADLTKRNAYGGWEVELQAFFFLGALCICLLGAGKLALDGRKPSPAG